jgi:hypothetical protein
LEIEQHGRAWTLVRRNGTQAIANVGRDAIKADALQLEAAEKLFG